jgi:hypothetical protein
LEFGLFIGFLKDLLMVEKIMKNKKLQEQIIDHIEGIIVRIILILFYPFWIMLILLIGNLKSGLVINTKEDILWGLTFPFRKWD